MFPADKTVNMTFTVTAKLCYLWTLLRVFSMPSCVWIRQICPEHHFRVSNAAGESRVWGTNSNGTIDNELSIS